MTPLIQHMNHPLPLNQVRVGILEDPRHQFRFITDLTVRGKATVMRLGVEFAVVPAVAMNSSTMA